MTNSEINKTKVLAEHLLKDDEAYLELDSGIRHDKSVERCGFTPAQWHASIASFLERIKPHELENRHTVRQFGKKV